MGTSDDEEEEEEGEFGDDDEEDDPTDDEEEREKVEEYNQRSGRADGWFSGTLRLGGVPGEPDKWWGDVPLARDGRRCRLQYVLRVLPAAGGGTLGPGAAGAVPCLPVLRFEDGSAEPGDRADSP